MASAETSIWRVSNNGNELYLGGTVNLLSKSDHPLPDEYEQAFRSADVLVLEADLNAFDTPEAKQQLLKSLMYNGGVTLKDKLTPETFRTLARYCRRAGISLDTLQSMKPSLVVLTLTMTKLKNLDMAGAGVDQFFLEKAKAQKKLVIGLESAEDQIQSLENMGKGQENELILSTIKEINKTKTYVVSVVKAWRSGNLTELENIGINQMRDQFPGLNQSLLTARNQAWLPKIETMLKTKDKELILVGALHLAGGDGILARLKSRGYRVEQY
jgi:uncharacterized protein YbaP (TraB family)